MDKKYQVFISSTFNDLVEERRNILQTVLNMNCIPAGMELFPAIDEDQLKYIKKVIDLCDYYILLVGGRYGSLASDGVSYTEKEFDYAVSKDVKVIAIIHSDPSKLPRIKRETTAEMKSKLELFTQKVRTGRLVKFWSKPEEIEGTVAVALSHAMGSYPAVGWIRANVAASEEILQQLITMRTENDELKSKIQRLEGISTPKIDNIAGLDEEVHIKYKYRNSNSWIKSSIEMTWRELFGVFAPHIRSPVTGLVVKMAIESYLKNNLKFTVISLDIDDQDFQKIGIQYESLGLISIKVSKTTQGTLLPFWFLTTKGNAEMYKLLTVKSKR